MRRYGKAIDNPPYFTYNRLTMLQSVSISSKNQVTIPSVFSKALKLKRGQKLVVEKVGNTLVFTPSVELVRQASGMIQVSKPISNTQLERIIQISKQRHFSVDV